MKEAENPESLEKTWHLFLGFKFI